MNIGQIRLYDLFRRELHLADDKAAAFVVAVAAVIAGEAETQKQLLATKDDIYAVKDDMNTVKAELKDNINAVKTELKNDMNAVKAELKDDIRALKTELKNDIHQLDLKIEQSKSDLHKSIFLSGLIQFITIIGALIAILKFMKFN